MKLLISILAGWSFIALALLFFAFFIFLSWQVPESFMMYIVYGGFFLSFYLSYLLLDYLKKKFKR